MTKSKWPANLPAPDGEGRIILVATYQNVGEVGIAIVAVISCWQENDGLGWRKYDWSAYIGGSARGAQKEKWAVEDAVRHGNKLSLHDAQHFFPQLPVAYYRL